jgi:Ni/Co efflux regulator RcnB
MKLFLMSLLAASTLAGTAVRAADDHPGAPDNRAGDEQHRGRHDRVDNDRNDDRGRDRNHDRNDDRGRDPVPHGRINHR